MNRLIWIWTHTHTNAHTRKAHNLKEDKNDHTGEVEKPSCGNSNRDDTNVRYAASSCP